jgi:hypothetical protein
MNMNECKHGDTCRTTHGLTCMRCGLVLDETRSLVHEYDDQASLLAWNVVSGQPGTKLYFQKYCKTHDKIPRWSEKRRLNNRTTYTEKIRVNYNVMLHKLIGERDVSVKFKNRVLDTVMRCYAGIRKKQARVTHEPLVLACLSIHARHEGILLNLEKIMNEFEMDSRLVSRYMLKCRGVLGDTLRPDRRSLVMQHVSIALEKLHGLSKLDDAVSLYNKIKHVSCRARTLAGCIVAAVTAGDVPQSAICKILKMEQGTLHNALHKWVKPMCHAGEGRA